jgi:hypothetical protein
MTILVPDNLIERVKSFIKSEGVSLEIVQDGSADLRIVQSQGRVQSDACALHAGGWIACPTARAIAGRLDVSPKTFGRLLDVLDIKVRDCELGCF